MKIDKKEGWGARRMEKKPKKSNQHDCMGNTMMNSDFKKLLITAMPEEGNRFTVAREGERKTLMTGGKYNDT